MRKRIVCFIAALFMVSGVFAVPVFADIDAQDFRWSVWSCEEPPEGSDLESEKVYRYRIITVKEEVYEYSRWSEWITEETWKDKKSFIESGLSDEEKLDIETVTRYRYKLPLLEQTIDGASNIVKTYGTAPFKLEMKAKTPISYTSSNSAVAEVSADGTVTVKKSGTAIIIAKAERSGDYDAAEKKITITVNKATQSITGSSSIGKTYGDSTFLLGMKAKTSLKYKSSNTNIVTVSSSGKVSIKNPGTATITVTAAGTDQYKTAVKNVKITVKLKKPSIEAGAIGNKKIKLRWSKVPGASKYQVYVYNSSTGKYVLKATGSSKSGSYTFKGVKGKTYKCKIRAYRIVSGKKVYSPFSSVKTIKAR